jgi:hypothetical protein
MGETLDENIITLAVAIVLVLLALLLALPLLRHSFARRRMENCISTSGLERMRNVLIEDGMGGLAFFEWLLMTPHEIRVLTTNPRDGIIFAGDRMDTWAQVVGKRTIRFSNPIYGIEGLLSCLRYHQPKVTTVGRILFMGNCSFPKGRPESVMTLPDLEKEHADGVREAVLPVVEQAWKELKEKARVADPVTEAYLLPVKESFPWLRGIAILSLLLACCGWLYWRL